MSADAPVKKPRGFKIALLILLILLLLLAAGIYFLPHILPTDTVRSIARERIKEATGLDVDFRAMRFGWTHGVTLEGVTVDVPNAGEGARLASFDSVRAAWAWRPLLSGMVAVEKLEVDGFAVRLVRDENGNLNLPEPPPAGPLAAASVPSANRLRLAAAVPAPDEGGKAAPIAIEVRSVELRRGTLTFDDLAGGLEAEAGLETLEIEGGPLDGEFAFSGRVKPYPSSLDAPAAPFSGKARLVRDLAFDPDGTAEIVIDVDGLPLGELAGKLQLGEALGSGTAGGRISANYDAGSIHAVVDGFRLDGVRLGRDDAALAVPDTKIALSADLRRDDPRVVLSGFSLENSLMEVTGRGWVDGVAVREESGIPWGEFEFAGRADVGGAAAYLEDGLGVGGLPDIAGGAGFSGKAAMPRPRGADPELRPSVSVAFTDGRVVAANIVEGVSGEIELAGVTIESALALGGAAPEIGATLNFDAIPVRALLADVSDQPVAMNLTGLGALRTADGAAQAELRLNSAGFDVPETPWAAPLRIDTTETRLVFDLARDRLDIDAANLTVNKTIRAGVRSGVVTGIRAGDPNGRIDMEFSAMLDTVENAFRPLIPAEIGGLEGSVRAALRAILSGGVAEMGANVELDKAKAALALPDSRVGVEADLATVGLSASIGLAATDVIRLDALRIDNGGATVQFSDRTGLSFAGRFGNSTLQASAALDLAASRAVISELKASTNGMSAVIGHDGVQTAAVTSGVLAAQVNVTPENAVAIPLGATGEFAIPEADFGVDNLVFHREDASGQDTASEFGQFAIKVGVDGRLGDTGSEVNLRRVEVRARPIAAQARGQFLPDSGAFRMEYAARVIPQRIRSLLAYLNIPPDLLENAEISGRAAWDGAQLAATGTAQGGLRFNADNLDPFRVDHDFTLAYSPAEEALNVEINSLNASVASATGGAIVTLAASPSTLSMSRNGVDGFVDVRFDGSAAPTRLLAAGLSGVVPQLREYAPLLLQTRAEGVYSAWAQLRDQGAKTIVLNVGGIWKGAALAVGATQIVSEPNQLAALMEGSYSLDSGRLEMTKLALNSETAPLRAEGSAGVTLPAASGGDISAVRDVFMNLRFAVGDLAQARRVFPGIFPADMQLAGNVNGEFRAAGDASAIRLEQGTVRFSNFAAAVGGLDFRIPDGAANYDMTMALRFDRPAPADGSPFAALRHIDVTGGRASLQGATVQGRRITDFSAAFQLQGGALDLGPLRVVIAGEPQGTVQLAGRVDFNRFDPAVDLALGVRQMPLAQLTTELSDFLTIESGYINLPASAAATTRISFTGLDEDAILQSVRFENFNFATGPVALHTGPKINVELDKARALLRQEAKGDGGDRLVTLESLTGSVLASGNGVIEIPSAHPIRVTGDNTGDFAIQGRVMANRTLDLEAMVAGKLERLLGFSLPSIIPNLRNQSAEEQNQFMAILNRNAANGHYKLKVRGTFDNPQISGIPELVMRVLADITLAAPGAVLGGVLNLGRDAPETLLNAPENLGRGLGNILGVNRGDGDAGSGSGGGRSGILPFGRGRRSDSRGEPAAPDAQTRSQPSMEQQSVAPQAPIDQQPDAPQTQAQPSMEQQPVAPQAPIDQQPDAPQTQAQPSMEQQPVAPPMAADPFAPLAQPGQAYGEQMAQPQVPAQEPMAGAEPGGLSLPIPDGAPGAEALRLPSGPVETLDAPPPPL